MYIRREDQDGRKCAPYKASSAKLFAPGRNLIVKRAPLMMGLSSLQKPFQRPMLKRRAYGKTAESELKQCSLGQKRRMNGMARLLARAGKGLTYKLPSRKKTGDGTDDDDSDEEEEAKEPDRPFEPLMMWNSPHNGAIAKGLPPTSVQEMRPDEYGVEMEVTLLKPAPVSAYSKQDVFVPPILAKWLRPHQREGVKFMYDCVMGLKDFDGRGCILADDMGLGKTLQSVTLIYTLIKTGIIAGGATTAKRVIVVCPCSLVKNWDNEFTKWLGPGAVRSMALAEGDRKTVEKNIDCFVNTKMFNILIASYECIRTHVGRLIKKPDCCDLLVCDEAHRLKNNENQTSRALNSIPVRRRVLLTGTPMQNDLTEFYAMVDFTNPGILGTPEEFRRRVMFPILRGREPDANESQKRKMLEMQSDLSGIVEEFILRRINTVNAEHLPPKLVQVVCCNLTDIQANMYQHLVHSKDLQHMVDGKQVNCLSSIQMLMKLSNHPSLVVDDDHAGGFGSKRKRGGRSKQQVKYCDDEKETSAAPGADGIAKFLPVGSGRVHPEWSGKMFVLYRLMKEMRQPYCRDKIVIISNYTQTLDLIGRMCKENSWGFCRLDGSVSMKKRQKMVDDFNDPGSSLIAFLLSSKAGGCGLNLIGGNRLVLFDPDWNPAVDKQAAARCWRDGQKKRCFTYRFLATGTVEEKIFQRQLSKEGLQSVVDDKEQVNALSTKDLRNLFKLRQGTPSDTHDKLRCERCKIIQDNAEAEALSILPKKLDACRELLDKLCNEDDARFFVKPLDPTEHGRTKEEYEKLVKQPMDLETIRKQLDLPIDNASAYEKPSGFSKDINRIFTNALKVWDDEDEIVLAAKRLQAWWMPHWVNLAHNFMAMKSESTTAPAMACQVIADAAEAESALPPNDNKRGEDYQEQIDWSHHYNVDTVDDPVFRVAMKGFDTVSFVFGLEVTWSLIQQRQQEEEERLAIQALENVGEEETTEEAVEANDSEGDDRPNSEITNEEEEEEDDVVNSEEMNDFIENDADSVEVENQSVRSADVDDEELSDIDGAVDNAEEFVLNQATVGIDGSELGMDSESDSDAAKSARNQDTVGVDEPLLDIEIQDEAESLLFVTNQDNIRESESEDSTVGENNRPDDEDSDNLDNKQDDLGNDGSDTKEEGLSDDPSLVLETKNRNEPNVLDPNERNGYLDKNSHTTATPTSTEPLLQVSTNEWSCPACTFINKKAHRKCRTCGSKKPSNASAPNSSRKRSRIS